MALIDEIEEMDFIKKLFGEDVNVFIDMSNLIVSGHSMGGATAMLVGEKDPRVKVVLSHDPWAKVIADQIPKFENLLSKYHQVVTSSHYACDGHDNDPFG